MCTYTLALARLPSRIVPPHFFQQPVDGALLHRNEPFRATTKVVNVTRVDIEPQCMDVQIVRFEPFLQKPVRRHILYLLQRVHLRQLVLQAELMFRIDVGDKLAQRCFRRKYQRFVQSDLSQVLKLVQAGLGVLTEPRPQR